MIVLDTHIWIWWVHRNPALPSQVRAFIESSRAGSIGISAISCWEVAKLVERQRIALPYPVFDWLQRALAYPKVKMLDFSPEIAVEATQLPGAFHRDPADQILVATARVFDVPLVTVDAKIRAYPHVKLAPVNAA